MKVSSYNKYTLLDWAKRSCSAFKVVKADFRAIGFEYKSQLAAAVFFDDFRGKDCNVSLYVADPRVVSRAVIREALCYPLVDSGLRRISAAVNSANEQSISLIERLGFKREGVRRKVYEDGSDELLYGMLREECTWLTRRDMMLDSHTGGAY